MKRKREKQFEFIGIKGWGGRRPGAGRPNLSGQVNHMKRPSMNLKNPLHITLRLKEKLPSIRNRSLFKEFKKSVKGSKRYGLYVIHFSVQSNHIHLFCECKSNKAVALGMRALAGRFSAGRGSLGPIHRHAAQAEADVRRGVVSPLQGERHSESHGQHLSAIRP